MITLEEHCRRNARALWVPAIAFGLVGVLCLVMMFVNWDFGWRAWAGSAFMAAASIAGFGRIRYWRRMADETARANGGNRK